MPEYFQQIRNIGDEQLQYKSRRPKGKDNEKKKKQHTTRTTYFYNTSHLPGIQKAPYGTHLHSKCN